MKLFLNVFLLGFVGISSGFSQDLACQDKLEKGGSIQLQMIPTSQGDCFISVHNFKTSGLVYRDYLFTLDGGLMVFNSFGNGSISETTGAREFFTFPRVHAIPQYNWNNEERRLEVTSVTGDVYYFAYENADLTQISNGQVLVASDIHPRNKGGVEISSYKGLILDVGFTMGKSPSEISGATSVFTDKTGNTCKIVNSALFKRSASGDVIFKHSDKSLAEFLKKNCPQLIFL